MVFKKLPLVLLACLALGTAVQVGCGLRSSSDDTTSEDPVTTHGSYGYGYGGHGGYGYGNGYGGYGYGK